MLSCSEFEPDHCHRRLVLEYLQSQWGTLEIRHIERVMIMTVTHLTRMRPPYFCVAGLEGKKAIRPVTSGQLHKRLLRCKGGPFAIGAIVDIGPVRDVGSAPELEDRRFDPARVRYVGMKTAETFWKDLKAIAQPRLDSIFGDDLVKRGRWSCGVDPGHGVVSLGACKSTLRLEFSSEGWILNPRALECDLQLRTRLWAS